MNKKRPDIERLKAMTVKKLGHGLLTPTDFNKLNIAISQSTGETISLSTLKRLWGYVDYPHEPSTAVLSILARFNGFSDWNNFRMAGTEEAGADDDSEFLAEDHLSASDIAEGQKLRIEWGADKGCTLEKMAGGRFRVISSSNIKLLPGDTAIFTHFCVGQPFYAARIERYGLPYNDAYMGARSGGGIRLITRLED